MVDSPLEHAEDVLTDVTVLVSEHLGRVLSLNKQEGDAVFGYALDGALDGAMLLDTVEERYFAFRTGSSASSGRRAATATHARSFRSSTSSLSSTRASSSAGRVPEARS